MSQLNYSYRRIFNIALPLILGNLAYSAIGFADMYFMKFVGPIEQGAISYVGHLYTTIFIMGYAYCKGVQILVANQVGADTLHKVGAIVDHAIITLLAMAMLLFFCLSINLASPCCRHCSTHQKRLKPHGIICLYSKDWIWLFFSRLCHVGYV